MAGRRRLLLETHTYLPVSPVLTTVLLYVQLFDIYVLINEFRWNSLNYAAAAAAAVVVAAAAAAAAAVAAAAAAAAAATCHNNRPVVLARVTCTCVNRVY